MSTAPRGAPLPEFPKYTPEPDESEIVARLARECREKVPNVTFEEGSLPHSLLRVFARRELALRARVNSAARTVVLATAEGADLDNVAAGYGVRRMRAEAGAHDAAKPAAAPPEADERLRGRARLALQALSSAGTEGAYLFAAMSAHEELKDVRVASRRGGVVEVRLLSIHGRGVAGDGPADEAIKAAVEAALAAVVSLSDRIHVAWGTVLAYTVEATVRLEPGLDAATVDAIKSAVLDNVKALVRRNHHLGHAVRRDEFFAAIYRPGVRALELAQPDEDRAMDFDRTLYVDPNALRIAHPADGEDDRVFVLTSKPPEKAGASS